MTIVVLKPGLLTTLQDRGRDGCAALGVGRAGPMDDVAFRLANALVGNDLDSTALELTLIGPRLRFEHAATLALTGATFDARIDGEAIEGWRAIDVDAGAVLDCGRARRGARGYLAIAGGFDVARVLGSAATDVNAQLGPCGGCALHEGDALAAHAGPPEGAMLSAFGKRASRLPALPRNNESTAWSLDPRPWFDPDPEHPIRLIRGSHFDALDRASRETLFVAPFRIASDSNRVGFRLDGVRLALAHPLELVSEPTSFGTVQLPPGGQPIVLMAEHPTTGGYPRIGQIIAIDLARLAQCRPGDMVRFAQFDLDEAQTRSLRRERELARLIEAIAARQQTGS